MGQGIGTILNDLVGVSINSVSVLQPTSGTTDAVFNVSVVGVSHVAATMFFATVDGTAISFEDFLPTSGVLTIPAGPPPSINLTVPILGESVFESPQTFLMTLYSPQHALVFQGTGVCTVINVVPPPNLYVNDVHVTTNLGGNLNAVFTVALDAPRARM